MNDTPRTKAHRLNLHRRGWNPHKDAPVADILKDMEQLEHELAEAIRERGNAHSDATQSDVDSIRALHERNEARAQRDRLAEALRDVAKTSSSTRLRRVAKQALAAVEGQSHE